MANPEQPQIYLISPPQLDIDSFPDRFASVLDRVEVACARLSLASRDETEIARAADALREVAHARDVPLVIEDHMMMVERLGLDGVHLCDGARAVRKSRKTLGRDAIVGAFCGASRHDGMNAGEAGADYVSFGPVGPTALGDGSMAPPELFAWWSEMIELPVVAEGVLDGDSARRMSRLADFLAFGEEIWRHDDPAARLKKLVRAFA